MMIFTLTLRRIQTILFVPAGHEVSLQTRPVEGGFAIFYQTPGAQPPELPLSGVETRVGTFVPIAIANYSGFVNVLQALGVDISNVDPEEETVVERMFDDIHVGRHPKGAISFLQSIVNKWADLNA